MPAIAIRTPPQLRPPSGWCLAATDIRARCAVTRHRPNAGTGSSLHKDASHPLFRQNGKITAQTPEHRCLASTFGGRSDTLPRRVWEGKETALLNLPHLRPLFTIPISNTHIGACRLRLSPSPPCPDTRAFSSFCPVACHSKDVDFGRLRSRSRPVALGASRLTRQPGILLFSI
jgi:hypothetical protein